jgi:DnaJ domain
MDTDFIDDDVFEAKRLEAEKKKQKKLEKQERLQKRKIAITELQKILSNQHDLQTEEFESCFRAASKYKQGTKEWAHVFLNLSENINLIEIRKKYIKLAQNWHPDKNNVTSNEAMKYLNEAWQILKK